MSRIPEGPDGIVVSSEPLAFYTDETANLKAHLSTLQGRLESLERTVTAMRERELKIRRAVGQLAAACELMK